MPTVDLSADRVFEALGDSNRRRIVELLDQRAQSVSALQPTLGITLAAVVQHIQVLEESGLVRTKKVGRVRVCQVSSDGLTVASDWIERRRARLEAKLDRLGDLLEGSAP
jgi:DNA-binding transcriptional ArsR family regulator